MCITEAQGPLIKQGLSDLIFIYINPPPFLHPFSSKWSTNFMSISKLSTRLPALYFTYKYAEIMSKFQQLHNIFPFQHLVAAWHYQSILPPPPHPYQLFQNLMGYNLVIFILWEHAGRVGDMPPLSFSNSETREHGGHGLADGWWAYHVVGKT